MSNQNLQFRYLPTVFSFLVFLIVLLPMTAESQPLDPDGEMDVPGEPNVPAAPALPEDDEILDPESHYTWKPLTNGADYKIICYSSRPEDGADETLICHNSCPSGAICAEYSNEFRDAPFYCCVPLSSIGSSNISDCMAEVELWRDGAPPEVMGTGENN